MASRVLSDITEVINAHVKTILLDIASTHNLDADELVKKYTVNHKTLSGAEEDATQVVKEKRKRGRKKKQKDEFIETEEYEYEGEKFLVDGNNNVYTYNIEEPMLVGERLVDGTIKLFEGIKLK